MKRRTPYILPLCLLISALLAFPTQASTVFLSAPREDDSIVDSIEGRAIAENSTGGPDAEAAKRETKREVKPNVRPVAEPEPIVVPVIETPKSEPEPESEVPPSCSPCDDEGISAAWGDGVTTQIVSGTRRWVWQANYQEWTESGRLEDDVNWQAAPRVDGLLPQEGGITAAWSVGLTSTVISEDRYWVWNNAVAAANPNDPGAGWTHSGLLSTAWNQAPKVDGVLPWQGEGVTAAFKNPTGDILTVISKDRYWNIDLLWGTWMDSGRLADVWQGAALVSGNAPFEGAGVTAAWTGSSPYSLVVVSRDRYWSFDGSTWTDAGLLVDLVDWQNAPVVD